MSGEPDPHCSTLAGVSHNDDFWSGSQHDPYGNQPTQQSPSFGDSVFDQPRANPADQPPPDYFGSDSFPSDEEQRRRVLATGPHNLGDDDGDPFRQSYPQGKGSRRRDDFSAKRRGPGFVTMFIAAAIVVALAAGAYAAYTVLNDTADFDQAATTDTTEASGGSLETTTTSLVTTTVTTLPPGLNIQLTSSDFVCNSSVQEFGLITGATPNEEVAFTSPQSSNLKPGQADENGRLPIRWSCTPDQVGTVWELTATGAMSGLAGTATFTGVAEGEGPDTTVEITTTTVDLGELTATLTESPFTCDGEVRVFGAISRATPNGQISFTSPQASGIRPGTADEQGLREMRWSCTPDQVGTVWELTATDDATGRTVTFELTGQ